MIANNSVLVIGPPKSGKTTFHAQFYARIQAGGSRIELTKTPTNIRGIKEAYEGLSEGKETEATPASENIEVVIPIRFDDKEFDLICKDYGGEQVRDITLLMEYDHQWQDRAQENDRWILFLRPSELYSAYDLSLTGYVDTDREVTNLSEEHELSYQYHFIELIQSLLYARETGVMSKLSVPKLLIVLTCWDELGVDKRPEEVLHSKAPLFDHFVDTLWEPDSYQILGLSAQGFPLDNQEARDKYLDELPESFGYIVLGDGTKEQDITRLIEIAISL